MSNTPSLSAGTVQRPSHIVATTDRIRSRATQVSITWGTESSFAPNLTTRFPSRFLCPIILLPFQVLLFWNLAKLDRVMYRSEEARGSDWSVSDPMSDVFSLLSLRSTNLGEMTKYQIDLDLIRFIKSSQLSRTLLSRTLSSQFYPVSRHAILIATTSLILDSLSSSTLIIYHDIYFPKLFMVINHLFVKPNSGLLRI